MAIQKNPNNRSKNSLKAKKLLPLLILLLLQSSRGQIVATIEGKLSVTLGDPYGGDDTAFIEGYDRTVLVHNNSPSKVVVGLDTTTYYKIQSFTNMAQNIAQIGTT